MEKEVQKTVADLNEVWQRLDLNKKIGELEELNTKLSDPGIWQDQEVASQVTQRQAELKKLVSPWQSLKSELEDLTSLANDAELAEEVEKDLDRLHGEFCKLKEQLRFNGTYDTGNAVLRLSAGAGGDDAQDWTEMLERMYLRFAEQNDLNATIIDRSAGENAGVKTSVIKVAGPFAYGKLRSENGVHRLVRLSPFNAESRETSFARVEVLPELVVPDDVKLAEKDLKIDVYRSSGHGGQSVNTTDSAVRITHLPTGITVSIQNEKSQLKNKETALAILRGKLMAMKMEQHAEDISEIKGESQSASWSQQIRNYVLHPYKLVKDTRTGIETANVDKVLDGDLGQFIDAYLEQGASN